MAINTNIAALRREYSRQQLLEDDASTNPIIQFSKWWNEALQSQLPEVNAMMLATCNTQGRPSARIVLLKSFNENGFIFFTNYNSKKGKELLQNPYASLLFFWSELERQVRIEGTAEKISEAESDEYFVSRPSESKLGAWSSPQSSPITGREYLEKNIEDYRKKFRDGNIPRPPHWGGYIVKPLLIEFWQGREGRLHDRLQYAETQAGWRIERLAP